MFATVSNVFVKFSSFGLKSSDASPPLDCDAFPSCENFYFLGRLVLFRLASTF